MHHRTVLPVLGALALLVPAGISTTGQELVRSSSADAATQPRSGLVRLSGRLLRDDQGEFHALGATLMWAAWGFRSDRARLERNLAFLASHGFDYIRALGVVGDPGAADPWDGREIDWRWPDYREVIEGTTDLAYDRYGLRVEWTLIGDGHVTVPQSAERRQLLRTFVDLARTRPHKILHFEIANEAWQNGFSGPAGLAELRTLTREMRALLRRQGTPVLVAASAPEGFDCPDLQRVYRDDVADLATIHFARDVEGTPWRPVWQPWLIASTCRGLPVASNNEPIGPGSSVESDADPYRLVSGAIVTYLAGLPLYVFHSSAGVDGRIDFPDLPNGLEIVRGLAAMKAYLPADLPAWRRTQVGDRDHPFRIEGDAGTLASFRLFVSTKARRGIALATGIEGPVWLRARMPLHLDLVDPVAGEVRAGVRLKPGERIELQGRPAVLLKGERPSD